MQEDSGRQGRETETAWHQLTKLSSQSEREHYSSQWPDDLQLHPTHSCQETLQETRAPADRRPSHCQQEKVKMNMFWLGM